MDPPKFLSFSFSRVRLRSWRENLERERESKEKRLAVEVTNTLYYIEYIEGRETRERKKERERLKR